MSTSESGAFGIGGQQVRPQAKEPQPPPTGIPHAEKNGSSSRPCAVPEILVARTGWCLPSSAKEAADLFQGFALAVDHFAHVGALQAPGVQGQVVCRSCPAGDGSRGQPRRKWFAGGDVRSREIRQFLWVPWAVGSGSFADGWGGACRIRSSPSRRGSGGQAAGNAPYCKEAGEKIACADMAAKRILFISRSELVSPLHAQFKAHDCQAMVVEDRASAMKVIEGRKADFIVFTCRACPGTGPRIFSTALHQADKSAHPVIVFTDKGSAEEARLYMEMGAQDYWLCPLTWEKIQAVLPAEAPAGCSAPARPGAAPRGGHHRLAILPWPACWHWPGRWPRPRPRCSFRASRGRARRCSPASSTPIRDVKTAPVRGRQLRGPARASAGERALRPREGRVHRGHLAQARQVRAGQRRNAASGRNFRDGPAPAGQAAARPAGRRDRSRGRRRDGQGGCARAGHHQPQPGAERGEGRVPPGPLLPPERHPPAPAAVWPSVARM